MLHIEKSIQELNENLKKMTDLTEGMVKYISDTIKQEDFSNLEAIFEKDRQLDEFEKILDEQAIALLAQINPMATDLRFVFSVIKLTVDLERIGDECKNAAKELPRAELPLPEEIKRMAEHVVNMIQVAFDALFTSDPKKARKVILMDDEADSLEYNIIKDYPQSMGLAFAAKALERIADHTTNIAENIVYVNEGIDIRHENTIHKRLKK